MLTKAQRETYAVGAFNINNLEILQGVINAARAKKSPVIIQTSESAIKYAGRAYLKAIVDVAAKESKIPIALHLDHGKDMKTIRECIKHGWTSVMIDMSDKPFSENIKHTKKVVQLAKKHGVSVEAELGTIGGAEDYVKSKHIKYTDPEKAKEFVKRTGIDALAVAIGTSHGAYKFSGTQKLDLLLLKDIQQAVNIPLVLHGASGVPAWLITKAARYGAKLGEPQGVSDEQIKQAIKRGITKINTDTDLRLAFDAAVRKHLAQHPEDIDPRHMLGPARELIQHVVEHRIDVFGSKGKA